MMGWTIYLKSLASEPFRMANNVKEKVHGLKWFLFMAAAWVALLFAAGCSTGSAPISSSPAAINSYCSAYNRVIRSEQEGASLHGADRPVKERIAANDSLYRCICEHWNNPICEKKQ